MDVFRNRLAQAVGGKPKDETGMLNPLVLAYVGDTVYDLAIRTMLIDAHDAKAHKLHVLSAQRVRAQTQAKVGLWLYPQLSDEEQAVFRRGRNAKPKTVPRHADLDDYCAATAFEAVLGYLYLSAQEDRLLEVLSLAAAQLEQIIVVKAEPRPYKG